MEKKTIQVLDLGPETQELWNPLMEAIQGVLKGGAFILGPNVKSLETEVAQYLGAKHAIAVNSGTDALVIGLRALGIGPGDEVITTPFTFFATPEAVSAVGATPVFVDIDPVTYNLDPAKVEARITKKTKAIIPVHLYGHPVEMGPILALAKKHGLKIVEDVAQAFGAEHQGKKVGTMGEIGAYSFFPSKNLGAFGDGGMITTSSDELAEACRMLRAHGSKKKYFNEVVGYNSRLDELQAAVLRVKLPRIDASNESRRQAAIRYGDLLGKIDGIVLPREMPGSKHVFHQYTIRVLNRSRDELQKKLADAGIMTMIYYPVPCHQLEVYKAMGYKLPEAEKAAMQVISLPMGPNLPASDQERIAQCLREALK